MKMSSVGKSNREIKSITSDRLLAKLINYSNYYFMTQYDNTERIDPDLPKQRHG
jgi:hypothetical protein